MLLGISYALGVVFWFWFWFELLLKLLSLWGIFSFFKIVNPYGDDKPTLMFGLLKYFIFGELSWISALTAVNFAIELKKEINIKVAEMYKKKVNKNK